MNKKLIAACMAGVLIFGIGIGVQAASDIRLFIHGKQVNADVQIIDGSSYVPLRVVSEALGANVNWDEESRTINIKKTRSFEVNSVIWSGSLLMQISKVTLDTSYRNNKTPTPINAVIFDVTITNNAYTKLKWYPKKGQIRLNLDEIAEISNPNDYSDDFDGTYTTQQVRKGKIVVPVKTNLDDVKTIDFLIDGSTDGETFNRVESAPIELR